MDEASTITGINEPIAFRYVNAQDGHSTVEGTLIEVKITPHKDGGAPLVHMRIRPKNISGKHEIPKTYNIDRVIDCFDPTTGEEIPEGISEKLNNIPILKLMKIDIKNSTRRIYRTKTDFPFPKISKSVYGPINDWDFTIEYCLADALDYKYTKFVNKGVSSSDWSVGNPRLYSFKSGTIIHHSKLPICLQIIEATPDTREGTSIARGSVTVQFFIIKKGDGKPYQKFCAPMEFTQAAFAQGLQDGKIVPQELISGCISQNAVPPV